MACLVFVIILILFYCLLKESQSSHKQTMQRETVACMPSTYPFSSNFLHNHLHV